MFQPELTRDELLTYRQKVDRLPSRREKQDLSELPEIDQLLPADLSPNKRAVIETLVNLWEAKSKN